MNAYEFAIIGDIQQCRGLDLNKKIQTILLAGPP